MFPSYILDSREESFLIPYLPVFVTLFCFHRQDNISIPYVLLYCFHIHSYISFHFHHSVSDADMRLDVLRRICVLLQLFTKRSHKHSQGSNIVIPTAAPNVLGNKGMG